MLEDRIKLIGSYTPLGLILLALIVLNMHKPLKTVKVSMEGSTSKLFFSGVTNPINTFSILSPVDGVLKTMTVQYGSSVNKDEVLFTIKPTKLDTDFRQGIEEYVKAKSGYHNMIFQNNGNKELFKLGLISKVAYMDNEAQLRSSELALLGAEERMKKILQTIGVDPSILGNLSYENMDKVKLTIQDAMGDVEVKSPGEGVLLFSSNTLGTARKGEGGPVRLGNEVKLGDVLGVVANMTGLLLSININENNFHNIEIGDRAEISGSAFKGITLIGKVVSRNRQASGDDANAIPTYTAQIEVPKLTLEQRNAIQVGMSAQIELHDETPPMIKIPLNAIINRDNQYWVNVLDENRNIQKVQVETGKTDESTVQILSGLKSGDEIVLPD